MPLIWRVDSEVEHLRGECLRYEKVIDFQAANEPGGKERVILGVKKCTECGHEWGFQDREALNG